VVYFESPLISYEDGLANVTGQVYNAASDLPEHPIEFPVSGEASNLTSGTAVPIGSISGAGEVRLRDDRGHGSRVAREYRGEHEPGRHREGTTRITAGTRSRINGTISAFTGRRHVHERRGQQRLYVTDFQNKVIRVLDHTWADITARVPFVAPPGIPAEYSPYNIQFLGGRLYVAYAAVDPDAEEPASDAPAPEPATWLAYDLDGHILQEFADAKRLNSPWGLAIAPPGFGALRRRAARRQFRQRHRSRIRRGNRAFKDYLRDAAESLFVIDKIWGLAFGNVSTSATPTSLYFTPGSNEEQDGIFGRLRYVGTAAD
jgi:hypothetical protein